MTIIHIGKRIKEISAFKGIKPAELARRMKISPQKLNYIFRAQKPHRDTINQACEALEITITELMEYDELKKFDIVNVPFLSVKSYASFIDNLTDCTMDKVEERYQVYYTNENPNRRQFVIEVSGESMEPTIKDGSKVLAEEVNQADWVYASSGVYAVVFRNQFVIKRMITNTLMQDKVLVLHSDNEKHGSVTVLAENIRCMFKVLKIIDQKV